MKKGLLIVLCYVPVLWGIILYKELGLAQFFAGGSSFCVGLFILIFQKDIHEFKRLSIHQFIGAVVAYVLSGFLALNYVSSDFLNDIFVVIAVIVGIVGFFIQFGVGYIISKMLRRNRIKE